MDYQRFLAALCTEHALQIPEPDIARLRSIDDLVAHITAARPPR